MSLEHWEQLALDTLYERRMNRERCFVSNAAGIELIEAPRDAVPVIEHVLRDVVQPKIRNSAEAERRCTDRAREILGPIGCKMPICVQEFPGLDYLLGAYLLITARSDPNRAVAFLAESPNPVLVEVLAAVRIFFNRSDQDYGFHEGPPDQLHAFVRDLTGHEDEAVRSAAETTLKRVVWQRT